MVPPPAAPPPPPPAAAAAAASGKKNIEDQDWYHGFRPRKDAARLIREPGEFLVRATDTGPSTDIVVTACDETKKVVNITLRFDGTNWSIAQKNTQHNPKHRFPSIVELIEHYRAHPPSSKLKLTKIVPRPEWMLKHENVIYKQDDKLGAGNFCLVYKGKLKRTGADPINVAIKISLSASSNSAENETEEAKLARRSMMHEAQIMSYYTHDNIIQFCGVACDHVPVLVVMEFCAGGDLLSHLNKYGKKTDDREKLIYVYEASRGMFYLHSKKCVHRDLAARNCLISSAGRIKIADFGLSKLIDEEANEEEASGANASNAQVPVRWMAPETLKKPALYTSYSDIWAFGVLTYEVFNNGVKPWPDEPVKFVATQIRRGNMPKPPEGTPAKICDMMGRMWAPVAEKRPGMRVIARELNSIIKEQNAALGPFDSEKMTINKIPGVKRNIFFEHDDTSEFEDSSNSTVENDSVDKADKCVEAGRKRNRASRGGPSRRTASNREK